MSGEVPPPPEPPSGNGGLRAPDGSGARTQGGTPGHGYDRVPPHSLEAEVSVLGAALLSRTAAGEALEILATDDFYRNAHRTVFEAIQTLFSQGEPVDTVTITDWLARRDRLDEVGGAAALLDLTVAVPTAANAAHYANIVRETALLRRLIDAGTQVARLGYEATEDATTVVDRAESLIYEVSQTGSTSDYAQLKELLNETFEQIEQLAEHGSEVTGLPTGFDELDRLTAGLQAQNLIIIAARPAMGKSSLCLNLSQFVSVEARRPSIIFSLEMSKLEIVNRLLSSEAKIDSSKLRTGRLEDTDWRKLGDALGKLSEAPLFIDDTPSISLMEIRAKCRRLKQKHGLELVIVDYMQLMQSHRRVDSRQQEVAEISRGLKMLAKELDVPVLALSQLSRQPEARTDKRPQLADLRESGCLTRQTRLFRADTGLPVSFGELLDQDLRDVPVWASDEDGHLVAAGLTHAFASGVKQVYRVRLTSGLEVEASGNHPFRTGDGWRALDELDVGSQVAAAGGIPQPQQPQRMDADELVLLAHLVGGGTVLEGQPIRYASADEECLEAVEKAAWHRFGVGAVRDPGGGPHGTTQLLLPTPRSLDGGQRNSIAAWLDELDCWDRAPDQMRLPGRLFGLPEDQIRELVHHLWAADARREVAADGPPDVPAPAVDLVYTTPSHGLARDVQLLLLRLDLHARLCETVGGDGSPNYQVGVHDPHEQQRFLAQVGVHGQRGELAAAALSSLDEAASTSLVAPTPGQLHDLRFDEIVAIEPLGELEVYDATVAEHHSFVAEGFVLHNSIEQDADIVGFIYRDEVYDEDSPDRGIAELIIAKHRNGRTGTVRLAFLDHLTKFANLARGTAGGQGAGAGGPGSPMPPV